MLMTFWSLSVTNTGFSPASMHFLAHAACAALAPLAPHLESLIQPSQLMSFAAASMVMLMRYSPTTKSTRFSIVESPFELAFMFPWPSFRNQGMDRKLRHRAHAGLFMERVPRFAAQPIHPESGTTSGPHRIAPRTSLSQNVNFARRRKKYAYR